MSKFYWRGSPVPGVQGALWIAFAAILIFPVMGSQYIAHLAVVTACFAILAMSLNLTLGHTGMVSIAHAALFGVGAYSVGILTDQFRWGFWEGLAGGGVLAALVATIMGLLFARMRGSYFSIGTFAFGELVRIVMTQWRDVTHGPLGYSIAARPELGLGAWTLQINTEHRFYGLVLFLFLALLLFFRWLRASRLGIMMSLVRDDPDLAASTGVPVLNIKLAALFISGLIAGAIGGLYGSYMQFITPEAFSAHQSIQLVMMVIIGGAGTLLGPFVGALVIVLLPQVLRIDPTLSLVAIGVVLILVVLLMPKGIVGQLGKLLERQARRAAGKTRAQAISDREIQEVSHAST